MNRYLRLVGPLVVLCIFLGASWLLYAELRHYHLDDLEAGLRQIPSSRLLVAVLLTALNYVILVGYDLLAVRCVGARLSIGRIAMASFTGYVSSFNFGVLLGGSSVRYRLYSAWGLSPVRIVQLIAMLGVTFWLGVTALAGAVFVLHPLPAPARLHLPITNLWPLGVVFLTVAAAYLSLCALARRPVHFFRLAVPLPSFRMSLAQIAVAAADLIVAAGAFYVLLPGKLDVGYPTFLSVYLLAVIASATSQVPAGLGVFELLVLVLLSPHASHEVVAPLVVYRFVYYWIPLALGALLLGAYEIALGRRRLGKLAAAVGTLTPSILPRLLALLVFAAGAVLLFSGALPIAHGRAVWLRDLLPLAAVEVSHFLGSVVGVALLLVAYGLLRRRDSAYSLTVMLLVAGIVFSLLKGFDYEESLILLAVLMILLATGKQFYRKGAFIPERMHPGWLAAVVLVLASSVWLGLFAYKHVEYSNDLWWRFAFRADVPRFLRGTVGATTVLLLFGLYSLLKPAAPRLSAPQEDERELVKRIVATSPDTYANLALLGDKRFLFDEQGTAFVMYAVRGRTWVVMGDPVGPPSARRELAWQFRELSDRYDGWSVFYQVGQPDLPLYVDLGLSLLKLGEEGRVPLPSFSLEGRAHKGLRHLRNRLISQRCSLEIVPSEQLPGVLPELKQISDAWLAEKDAKEKSFSLGYFDQPYLTHFPIAVVRQEAEILAFANLWCGAEKKEISVDLMRYRPGAPSGVMEFLFIELMLWARHQGYDWFNLGMAPMSGLESRALSPIWHRLGSLLFQLGEQVYDFQGLRQYKEKFDPIWRPKYLAAPSGLALPQILMDIIWLVSGESRELAQAERAGKRDVGGFPRRSGAPIPSRYLPKRTPRGSPPDSRNAHDQSSSDDRPMPPVPGGTPDSRPIGT